MCNAVAEQIEQEPIITYALTSDTGKSEEKERKSR
jgi:hypothetical protein